jgi:hypothetical protein
LSPPVWWCTRARSRASATASWATRRRTAATSSRGDHHVINRRMNMADAMMLFGRSQCREGSADQRQKSAEKKYSSDRHVALLRARTIPSQPQCSLTNDSRQRLAQLRFAVMPARRFQPPWSAKERKRHTQQSRRPCSEPAALPFPRSNTVRGRYRPGLASRSSPRVASLAKGGGRSVRLAKHTPATCALKRRFCDNGTKLCPPGASRRRGPSKNWTPASSSAIRPAACLRLFRGRGRPAIVSPSPHPQRRDRSRRASPSCRSYCARVDRASRLDTSGANS